MVAAYTAGSACATWCAPRTRTCAAAGERHPRLEETLPPRPAGEHERLEARPRSAPWPSSPWRRRPPRWRRRSTASRPRGAQGRQGEGARHAGLRGVPGGLRAHRTFEVAEREHRDHTMLRALLELYGERYERLKRERSGLDFEDLELITRDLLAAARGPARGLLVALRARAGGRVPGHQRAPERAARAARARQPVPGRRREPVDLPLQARRRGRVPQALGEAPRPRAGPRASPSTSARAGRSSTRSTSLSSAPGASASSRCARRRARASPDRVRRRAWSCSWWTEGEALLGRACWRAEPDPFGEPMHAAPPVAGRRGAAAREARGRAHARGAVVVRRRGDAVPRDDRDGSLRARARGARDTGARGRRSRLLGPAAGDGPAPLARRACEPARRARRLLRPGLAARRGCRWTAWR